MPRHPHGLLRAAGPLASLLAAAGIAIIITPRPLAQSDGTAPWLAPYVEPSRLLIREAYADDFGWRRLAELTDTFGHRFSGSAALEDAIRWAADQMRADGLDLVRLDPVLVPRWVRGAERAAIVEPAAQALPMLGLGGSVATPPGGLEAAVLVVRNFDELEARAGEARGRIVLFNAPFTTYNETVQYRTAGPAYAARLGAVGALVRSIGPTGQRTPHTGATTFPPRVPRIPAAAISAEDANRLQRLQDRGVPIVVRLEMEAHALPDSVSHNLVAELRGQERPEEVVVVGCHIDSWDVGTGASDDGGGCVAAWEAVRLIGQTGLRPRRSIRLVLFTNEENGLRGARAYRDRYLATLDDHVLMLEADIGLFPPLSFGFTGSPGARIRVSAVAALVRDLGVSHVGPSGGGADIAPSVRAAGIPSMSLEGDDTRFFAIHHTEADTVDKIAPEDVSRATAAIAVMAYVIADMPARLDQD
jgi:carboxypeptidase Q